MRGTCSPGFRVASVFAPEQILTAPFADICAQTMAPFSHILWSACWLGIAADAVHRARLYLRARARRSPGPAPVGDVRLAEAANLLQQMRANVYQCAGSYADLLQGGERSRDALASVGFAIEMNQLKIAASELVVEIVAQALAICGMAGYQAGGPYSVERHLRDAYSAGCMIGNQRLRTSNATLLLAQKAV
jgi:acyl-CoA dehydrogenase